MKKKPSKKNCWRLEDQAWWQKYSAQIKSGEIETCRPDYDELLHKTSCYYVPFKEVPHMVRTADGRYVPEEKKPEAITTAAQNFQPDVQASQPNAPIVHSDAQGFVPQNVPFAGNTYIPKKNEDAKLYIPQPGGAKVVPAAPLLTSFNYTYVAKNYVLPNGKVIIPIAEAIKAGLIKSAINGSGIIGSGLTSGYLIFGSGLLGSGASGILTSGTSGNANGFYILAYGLNLI